MSQQTNRQIHLDFHTSSAIPGIGEHFDKKQFISTLQTANVDSINLFAKCHHGMYYYPSKIGTMHPNLKFNLLKEQMDACKDHGIRALAYTCVVWNDDWAQRHPEWQQVLPDGTIGRVQPFASHDSNWKSLCCNNRAHVQYIKDELKEIYTMFNPAGFWIDIIFQFNCVCNSCLEEMTHLGWDPRIAENRTKHDRLVETRFMEEIREFINKLNPELEVFFNGHVYEPDLRDVEEYSTHRKRQTVDFIDVESLPSEIWGYTHFPININYLNHQDFPITMMNGKFQKTWGDFGSLRNLAALEYECFRALANGAGCCIGDQLHPSGKLDQSVYERIGLVYESIKHKEPWCNGTKKVSNVGVYLASPVLKKTEEHMDGYSMDRTNEGVYRMLSELQIPFDFIDFTTSLEKYALLIIPDSIELSQTVVQSIKEYIKQGGKILCTGTSGISKESQDFEFDFGIRFDGKSQYTPRYMRQEHKIQDVPQMDLVLYQQGTQISVTHPETQVLASAVNPYFNREWNQYCSHRQTPPQLEKSSPVITQYQSTIYIAHPLFNDYADSGMQAYKKILQHCLKALDYQPLISAEAPSSLEVTIRKKNQDFILHFLHYIPVRKTPALDIIEDIIPLYNIPVTFHTKKTIRSITLVPEQENLSFTQENEHVTFTLPKIHGHQMICLQE